MKLDDGRFDWEEQQPLMPWDGEQVTQDGKRTGSAGEVNGNKDGQ